MKVGTDGTLLGAWANGGRQILDIGTGTGLVALMMAQRHPGADIVGIDIDEGAVAQAIENVAASPFRTIRIEKADAAFYCPSGQQFQAIVSNPPYFGGLNCPDAQRNVARHSVLLSFRDLIATVCRLLSDDGEFSVIIPTDMQQQFDAEASLAGLFMSRRCLVRTRPAKPPKRCLLAYRRHSCTPELTEQVLEIETGVRSEWYQTLTEEFYL